MKFVQSLYCFKEKDHTFWRNSDTDESIWKLSNIYLNRIGADCEFWGCDKGIAFVKKAGLKFKRIEKIPELGLHPRFWSLPKIYVASMQDGPFLHLDGDVFLKRWNLENFPEFIVQNHEGYFSERGNHWFYGFCSFLFRNGRADIAERIYDLSLKYGANIFNFGIFGGCNKDIPKICKEVFDISVSISHITNMIPTGVFVPCVMEQILVPMLVMEKNIIITQYLDGNISHEAKKKGYCHLLGPIKKKKETIEKVLLKIKQITSMAGGIE